MSIHSPIPTIAPVTRLADAQRLYLDFDSFFATAEQHFNKELRGKPVGVVPLDTPHTGCIAVSREAKQAGVPWGATIKVAKQHAPDMVFVVARPDAYVRLHKRILEVIDTCLPVTHVRSIDEVVCHLLPSEALRAADLANDIKRALAHAFSATLTCSIGIGATELLAKIAAEMEKPDGLVLLRRDDLPKRLAHLSLKDLPGISEGIEQRLNKAGVHDIPALWTISPKHARALWGNVEGERFWNGLHGLHSERPDTVKRMFGHSRILPPDWRTPDKVHMCARQLTMGAARRLRRAGMRSTRMSVSLRGGEYRSNRGSRKDNQRWSHDVVFEPARDDHTFLQGLAHGLHHWQNSAPFKPRSVSVMLHGLCADVEEQTDIFSSGAVPTCHGDDLHMRSRWENVSDVMDRLRSSHGPQAISLGPPNVIPGGYLGAKIAFGRIPDMADFNENQTRDGDTHFCSHG